jgi:hypothetical protein
MAQIRIKRGTRAQIDAAAAASQLAEGEPYLVTDEGRMAVGIASDAYSDAAALGAENTFTAAQTIQATSDTATLGDELTANGTFTGNADGWTLGTNWAYGANNVVLTLDGATEGTLSQNISVISGGLYLVEWVQTNSVANNGTIRPSVGSADGVYVCPTSTSAATMSQVITATATGTVALTFAVTDATSSGTITIDSVTVKQLTPIDATLILKDIGNTAQLEVRVANSANDGNVALGNNALRSNTTGYNNSAQGANALQSNTAGYNNSAHGADALYYNTTGYYNSAQGAVALRSNTTGYNNSAHGGSALRSNTTGYNNSAHGADALYYNTTGYSNSAQGGSALRSNTTGYNNSAHGMGALYYNTTGYNNSAQGVVTLRSNTTGYSNSAQGAYALYANTAGYYNSAHGVNALSAITTGYNNAAVGYNSGLGITTGSYNTILGASVGGLASGLTGNIILAANGIKAQFDGTNWILQGSLAVGPTSPSAKIHAQATTEQLRIGYDATHYASATVDSAGNLAIIPTNSNVKFAVGWKDLTSSMLGAGMPSQNAPTLTNFAPGGWTIRREYAFALNDYVYMQSFHVNHDIKPGGKAYIHMHWTTDGTSAAAVKWEFSYSRAKGHNQQAFSSPTTVSVTQAASGTAYQHMVAEIADIDALTLTEPDELIIITARRVTNGGTDNSDTVFGLMVDLHYEAEYYATKNKTPNFYS